KLDLELVPAEASTTEAMIAAVTNIPDGIDAVLMLPDSLAIAQTATVVQTTYQRRLPLAGPTTAEVKAGRPRSFGGDLPATGKQAARLADQILRLGISPAEIPVETSEFELAVNLKAARTIGLPVPDDVVQQANLVIP